MKHFVLMYDYVPDFMDKRAPFRAEHLSLARASAERGELLAGGALTDEPAAGLLLFQGEGPEAAIAFAEADPYVRHGVVRSWRVRAWTTVVGPLAANPV